MARLDVVNARIGARRSRRRGAAGVRELLARCGLDARLALLREDDLGRAVPAAGGGGREVIAAAEAALRAAARAEGLALLEEVEGEHARRLLAAFLGLDEARAVTAVLRAVAWGAPVDAAVAAAPPGPLLDDATLRAAAAAPDVRAAARRLADAGSEIAAAAAAALPPEPRQGLVAAELAAERAALARAFAACAGGGEDGDILAAHLHDHVDARNAVILLALGGAPPAVDPWLEGGARLPASVLDRLARAGLDTARARIAQALGVPAAALATPASAERALEVFLVRPLDRAARRAPLSIAVPLWFLLVRRADVRAAALVLRGAALGLPGDELLDLAGA